MFSKVHICGLVIAYFEDIANLKFFPYLLHFSCKKMGYKKNMIYKIPSCGAGEVNYT